MTPAPVQIPTQQALVLSFSPTLVGCRLGLKLFRPPSYMCLSPGDLLHFFDKSLICFNSHEGLCQTEENKCMCSHSFLIDKGLCESTNVNQVSVCSFSLFMPFIRRPLHFFSKCFPLLFLFLCYP